MPSVEKSRLLFPLQWQLLIALCLEGMAVASGGGTTVCLISSKKLFFIKSQHWLERS